MFCPFCVRTDSVIRLPSSSGIDEAAQAIVQVIKVAFPRRNPAVVLEGVRRPVEINEPKATERISSGMAKCLRSGHREVGELSDERGALAKITIDPETLLRWELTVPSRGHSLDGIGLADLTDGLRTAINSDWLQGALLNWSDLREHAKKPLRRSGIWVQADYAWLYVFEKVCSLKHDGAATGADMAIGPRSAMSLVAALRETDEFPPAAKLIAEFPLNRRNIRQFLGKCDCDFLKVLGRSRIAEAFALLGVSKDRWLSISGEDDGSS